MHRYYLTNIGFIYRVSLITSNVEYLDSEYLWKKSEYYTKESLDSYSNRPHDGLGKIFKVSKKNVDKTIKERIKEDRLKLIEKLVK